MSCVTSTGPTLFSLYNYQILPQNASLVFRLYTCAKLIYTWYTQMTLLPQFWHFFVAVLANFEHILLIFWYELFFCKLCFIFLYFFCLFCVLFVPFFIRFYVNLDIYMYIHMRVLCLIYTGNSYKEFVTVARILPV